MKYIKLFEGFNTNDYYMKIDQSDFNDQSKPWKNVDGLTQDEVNSILSTEVIASCIYHHSSFTF